MFNYYQEWSLGDQLEKNVNCAPGEVNMGKEDLSKLGGGAGMPGSVNTTGGPSIGSQIGFPGIKKEEHSDKKEDEKLIDKKIKEHEEKKHSLTEHKKQHEKLKIAKNGQWSIEKEDLQKNPLIATAVGAAATGFGSKMADRISDKVGL